MTNFVQNSSVASGALSSPLAGSGTTPASVKLRQWRPAPAGCGRLACGESGAAAVAGTGRGKHLGEPGPAGAGGVLGSALEGGVAVRFGPQAAVGGVVPRAGRVA